MHGNLLRGNREASASAQCCRALGRIGKALAGADDERNGRVRLVEMLTAEKNRRANAPKVLHRSIDEHVRWLEKRLSGFDDELGELIRDTPLWRERDELLRSVPGGRQGALEYSARAVA